MCVIQKVTHALQVFIILTVHLHDDKSEAAFINTLHLMSSLLIFDIKHIPAGLCGGLYLLLQFQKHTHHNDLP